MISFAFTMNPEETDLFLDLLRESSRRAQDRIMDSYIHRKPEEEQWWKDHKLVIDDLIRRIKLGMSRIDKNPRVEDLVGHEI